MVRPFLSVELGMSRTRALPFSSLVVLEVLSLRRVPTRGGGEESLVVGSISADLGLYLGRADVFKEERGRRVEAREVPRLGLAV